MSAPQIDLTEDDLFEVLRHNGVDPDFVAEDKLEQIFTLIQSEEDRVLSGSLYFDDPREIHLFAQNEIGNILREKGLIEINPELSITVSGSCLIRSDIYERYNKIRDEIDTLAKFGNVTVTFWPSVDDGKPAHEISVDIHNAVMNNMDESSIIVDALSEISKRALLGSGYQVAFVRETPDQATTFRAVEPGIVPGKVEVIDFGYENDGEQRIAERIYQDAEGDFFAIRREAGELSAFKAIGPYRDAGEKEASPSTFLTGASWSKVEPELFVLISEKLEHGAVANRAPSM